MNKNILLALFICANIAYAQTPDSTAVRTGTPVTPTPPVVMSRDGASAEKLNQSSFFGIGAQLGFATGTGITVRYTDPRRRRKKFFTRQQTERVANPCSCRHIPIKIERFLCLH